VISGSNHLIDKEPLLVCGSDDVRGLCDVWLLYENFLFRWNLL